MKRNLQKLLAMLFSLALLLSLCPAALAEEPEAPEEERLIDEERLNQWMDEYLRGQALDHNWQDVSVGFCYTATGDCWYYNADVFMYSASLYKVPVCMLMAEKEAAGEVTPETTIQGSTLQYLESSALTRSNNDSGHALVSYLGGTYQGKCSDMSIPYTSLPEDYFDQDFFDHSYYTARYMTQIMQTLYEGGEERFPHVIEYLLPAQPGEYLELTLGQYEVAQKYGAFTEKNGNNNNHIAAIVYTPTPVIITVMTRNVGDYQWRIAEIGAFLADYSLELDGKLAERERRAEEEAAAQRPGLIPALPAEIAQPSEAPAPDGTAVVPVPTRQRGFAPGAQIEGGRESLMPAFYVMCAAALATAVFAVYLAHKGKRRQPVRAASSSRNGAPRRGWH